MLTSQHLANSLKPVGIWTSPHARSPPWWQATSTYFCISKARDSTAMHCHGPACLVQVSFCQLSVQSLHSLAHEVSHYVSVSLKLKNGEERMTCGCHGKSTSVISVEVFKMAGLLEFWWVVQAFSSSLIAAFRSCALSSSIPSVNDQHLKAVLPMLSLHGFITNCPTSPFFTEASAKFLP